MRFNCRKDIRSCISCKQNILVFHAGLNSLDRPPQGIVYDLVVRVNLGGRFSSDLYRELMPLLKSVVTIIWGGNFKTGAFKKGIFKGSWVPCSFACRYCQFPYCSGIWIFILHEWFETLLLRAEPSPIVLRFDQEFKNGLCKEENREQLVGGGIPRHNGNIFANVGIQERHIQSGNTYERGYS